jgi:hypothetical protein
MRRAARRETFARVRAVASEGTVAVGDICLAAVRLGATQDLPPGCVLCVDEAQDLTPIQLAWIEGLRARNPHAVTVLVGDADQCIYGFRGASPDLVASWAASAGALECALSVTHRCPPEVVDAAVRMLLPRQVRMVSRLPSGRVYRCESLEAASVHLCDGAVLLAPLNAQLVRAARALRTLWPGDVRALALAGKPFCPSTPTWGCIPPDEWRALACAPRDGVPCVHLSTIHAFKGREAPCVVVIALLVPMEARLAYVACTRASRTLVWISPPPPTVARVGWGPPAPPPYPRAGEVRAKERRAPVDGMP